MHSLETVRRQREGQIERITQQSVYAALGEKALSACVPTCFYMAAQNEGHLPHEISLTDFCRELNWAHAETASGWIRPDLSHQLRELYDLPVVSWRFGGNYDNSPEVIEKMCRAGYLQTQEEIDFFRQQIIGRDISEVVQQCCPVIAGVKAGFGANKTVHAVILQSGRRMASLKLSTLMSATQLCFTQPTMSVTISIQMVVDLALSCHALSLLSLRTVRLWIDSIR